MKKRILSLTLVMAMIFTQISFISVFAETTTETTAIESAFTDVNFLNAVREIIGKTNGEHIYPSDVENITELNLVSKEITDLAGIEYFTGLETLIGINNRMETVDLSNNTNLVYLDISYNTDIKSINISQNVNLEELHFDYTSLRHIDISQNANLKKLSCGGSEIRELNLMNNTLLEELEAYESCLTYLDVSKNTNLTYLDCSYSFISTFKGLDNPNLEEACVENQLTDEPINDLFDEPFLEVIRNKIGKDEDDDIYQADVDQIEELTFYGKGVTSLDGIEHLKSLKSLDCMKNEVNNVSFYSNQELTDVDMSDNELEKIDVSGNTQLENLSIATNHLENVDLSNTTSLEALNVTQNQLTEIDLSNCESIKELECSENSMNGLDDISFPARIDISLLSNAETDRDGVNIPGFSLAYAPQKIFNIKTKSFISPNLISITGDAATNSRVDVYDITGINFNTKKYGYISDEQFNAALLLDYDDEVNGHKKTIDTIIDVNNKIPKEDSFDTGRKVNFSNKFSVSNQRITYKLFLVEISKRSDTILAARTIYVDYPYNLVTGLKYNHNYNSAGYVDIWTPKNATIITHGYHKKNTSFMVQIRNKENIEKAFVTLDRVKNNTVRHEEVELTGRLDDDWFYGEANKDIIRGTEYYGTGAYGTISIKCKYKDDPVEKELTTIYSKEVYIIYDPSGYIYEAVPSNRLSGVTTTLLEMDKSGEAVEWNAADFGQVNPIVTDAQGMYEWYVPMGLWKVRAEKEGYDTYETEDWLKVPPAQMDVNFGMISKARPTVSGIFRYPDAIEINFDKYVYLDDITSDNIIISVGNEQITGSIDPVDDELDSWTGTYDTTKSGGSGNTYVSKIKFTPANNYKFAIGETVKVSINGGIRSYAGVTIGENFEQEKAVEVRPQSISTNDGTPSGTGFNYIAYYKDTQDIEVTIAPVESSKNKKLILTTDAPWAISIPHEVDVRSDGTALIPVTGLLPGNATINMALGDSNLSMQVDVKVVVMLDND